MIIPVATADEQTVIIDLEKSGITFETALELIHIHSTVGYGKLEITDARLLTSADGSADAPAEPETEEQEDTTADNKEEDTTKAATNSSANETDGDDDGDGVDMMSIILVVAGGILVGFVAFKVSKNFA